MLPMCTVLLYLDECATVNGGCVQNCTNNIGSFQCSCSNGYRLNSDGFSCDDENECDTRNGGCDQNCTNSIGSFHCSCGIGYDLNDDGFSCNDTNECHTQNGCEQMCNNTIGSFQCVCGIGYALNTGGFTCDDVDECATANGGCGQICNNTISSFECSCHTGYILHSDGLACDDIDECETANGGCGQFCANTIGSFNCFCAAGYNLSMDQLTCDGFDPVSNLSCLSATKTSISVSWTEPAADIQGYSVMYIPVSGFYQPSLVASLRSRNDTSATMSGLFSGVEYSLTVLAFGLWNDSAYISVQCTTGLPPPGNFISSQVTENSATVQWTKPADAQVVAYRVWLTEKETALTVSTQYLLDSATFAAFTFLTPATEYVVVATCISPSVEGPQASVTIVTDTDPPRQLSVDDIGYHSLGLSWVPPVAQLTEYELTYSRAETSRKRRSLNAIALPGDVGNYWLQGLVPATQYVISLTAVSRFGRSDTINTTAKTGTDPPTDMNIRDVSPTWMHVAWTAPAAAVVSYDLTVTEAATMAKKHFSVSPAVTSFNITGLFPTTKYIIRIAVVSMYGRSVEAVIFGSTVDKEDVITDPTPAAPTSTAKLLSTTDTVLKTTTSAGIKISTNTFWLDHFDSTRPKREGPRMPTGAPTVRTALNGNDDWSTPGRTLSPLQVLQRLKDQMEQSSVEGASLQDVIGVVTGINDLLQLDTSELSSPGFSPELKEGIDVLSKSAELIRSSQGATVATMETLYKAVTQTVSSLVQMLPSGNSTILDTSSPLFEMAVIDVNSVDMSPKQQLKNFKDQQWTSAQQLRNSGLSLMESVERIADGLLAMLPDTEDYAKTFENDDVIVHVAKSTRRDIMELQVGPHMVSASPTHCALDGGTDAKMTIMKRNLFSWNASTFGENVTTPVTMFSWGSPQFDSCSMQLNLSNQITLGIIGEPPKRQKRDLRKRGLVGTQSALRDIAGGRNGNATMAHHAFDVPTDNAVVVMQLSWWDHTAAFRVFSRYDTPPTEHLHDDVMIVQEEDAFVHVDPSDSTITCNCNVPRPKAVIGGSLHVLPNSIDFDNIFQDPNILNDNKLVFCMVIGELALYLKQATPDNTKPLPLVSVLPPDRMPAPYLYQITVTTGSMLGAGTSARIGFQVFGSKSKTTVKMLNPAGESLLRGGIYDVIMPLKSSLGHLELLQIWHDNTGVDEASWFLKDIILKDLQTKEVYQFVCYDWLSEDRGDFQVQKVLHVATREQLDCFSSLFRENTDAMFYDQHLWTSPFVSPEANCSEHTLEG
ncbi:uncharacterized protein LOC144911822 [Branchiostoma floridae x Branchiostoma belcheri]